MTSHLSHLECSRCRRRHEADQVQQRCSCGGTLMSRYDMAGLSLEAMRARPPGTWRYRELLPVRGEPMSLGEHETALLLLPRLSERWGVEVWLKDEGTLPGATFKARGACVALSRAVELGVKKVVIPTAGNAGGTWSLYAARAGVEITVVMARTAPAANRAEVVAAGANLELVDGSVTDAGRRAKELAQESGAFLAATFSEPYRLEGKKSAWLEVFDALGTDRSMTFPRTIVMPVGGGVGAIAAAKAAEEVVALGWADGEPARLVGVQSDECAPIVRAFEQGAEEVPPWESEPRTVAAGLRVPFAVEGALVLRSIRESRGEMSAVAEEEIVGAMRDLATSEGVFAGPEGATAVLAGERLARQRKLEGPVVLYNTASAAKYVDLLT